MDDRAVLDAVASRHAGSRSSSHAASIPLLTDRCDHHPHCGRAGHDHRRPTAPSALRLAADASPSTRTCISSSASSARSFFGIREVNALRPATRPRPCPRLGADCSALDALRTGREAHRLQAATPVRWPRRPPPLAVPPRQSACPLFLSRIRLHRRGEVKLASKASARAHRARRCAVCPRAPRSS